MLIRKRKPRDADKAKSETVHRPDLGSGWTPGGDGSRIWDQETFEDIGQDGHRHIVVRGAKGWPVTRVWRQPH